LLPDLSGANIPTRFRVALVDFTRDPPDGLGDSRRVTVSVFRGGTVMVVSVRLGG
jgi:hypothetical protein